MYLPKSGRGNKYRNSHSNHALSDLIITGQSLVVELEYLFAKRALDSTVANQISAETLHQLFPDANAMAGDTFAYR